MNDEYAAYSASPVVVRFKSSTTKGGQEGYEITTTSAATVQDIDHAVEMAMRAREKCLTALGTPAVELSPEGLRKLADALESPVEASDSELDAARDAARDAAWDAAWDAQNRKLTAMLNKILGEA